jgi:hypothetical protein
MTYEKVEAYIYQFSPFNHWQGMEFSDCLQLLIVLLSGKFELVRARSGLNTVLKQKYFCPVINPTQNLQLSKPQTRPSSSQAVQFHCGLSIKKLDKFVQ